MAPTDLLLLGWSAATGLASHFYFHYVEPSSVSNFLFYPTFACAVERLVFGLDLISIIVSLTTIITALSVSVLAYRVVLPIHPLHHIPGPLLAKSTQLCQFISLVKGRPRVDQQILHQQYGPVVRIGPNEVSIADTSALSPIFGAKSWSKGKAYSFTASGGAATNETALSAIRDHKDHTARRRIWDRAFAIASLKGYQPSIEHRVQQLCNQLDIACSKSGSIDLQEWIGYLVFDVMTDLVVSIKPHHTCKAYSVTGSSAWCSFSTMSISHSNNMIHKSPQDASALAIAID